MHTEEIKDEAALVAAIKSALQQNAVDTFRTEMVNRIKKVDKKIQVPIQSSL